MGLNKKIQDLEKRIEEQIQINEAYKRFVIANDKLIEGLTDALNRLEERVKRLEKGEDDGK